MSIYKQDISDILFLLAFICPLWYINITLNGVLNGLGAMSVIFRNNLIASAINILFILTLVPKMGLQGFILGWFISICVQIFLGVLRVKKHVDLHFPIVHWLVKPALSAAAAGLLARIIAKRCLFEIMGLLPGLIVSLAILSILYISFLMSLGVISHQELLRFLRKVMPTKLLTFKVR